MRKFVLLLLFLVLFLFYSTYSDCPTVDNFSPNKMLDNFKGYFHAPSNTINDLDFDGDSDFNGDFDPNVKVESKAILLDEGLEGAVIMQNKKASKEAVSDELRADLVFEEKPKKLLDLSLPQRVNEALDINILNSDYESMLPDLFAPVVIEEEEDRMSFGGRVLMDEKFDDIELEQYRFQNIRGSIEGAEITLEVKTN